jgi:outer membrane protein OmpA-like peptidoglycan-associated protein
MSDFKLENVVRRPLFIVGAAGAVIVMLLGMFAPNGGAVWRLPQILQQRVAAALITSGHPGISVDMQGQRAVLHGFVETADDVAAVRSAALTSVGAGGPWAGGVTSADTQDVKVGAFVRPFLWSAKRDGFRLEISGSAPSNEAKAAIRAAVAQAFPNDRVVDSTTVAGGAPSPYFTQVVSTAIQRLAALNSGEVRIADDQLVFIGDGNQSAVNALRAAFANPPAPFRIRLDVTVEGLDVQHPELQGLNLNNGDAETCEHAFQRVMERNVINFRTGSADIDPSSRRILDALASVALRCDRFNIEVAGHTDNQGAHDMNMELSQRRADAVAAYLMSQGVSRDRLTSHGYGPDRPRADNATPEGQAANRRIEFNVSA